jgi:hypothetical protein
MHAQLPLHRLCPRLCAQGLASAIFSLPVPLAGRPASSLLYKHSLVEKGDKGKEDEVEEVGPTDMRVPLIFIFLFG